VSASYDLIIVGAGTAGLPAAIFAARRGARVCLIERANAVGGCLRINRGQMSGAGTRLQAQRGISDTPDLHYQDVMRLSGGSADPVFARMAVDLQGPFIDWLMDHGFEMLDGMPRILHGHEAYEIPRTYWGPKDGLSILAVLQPMLEAEVEAGRVSLFLETSVESLVRDTAGGVIGVTDSNGATHHAHTVLLASGGYGANPELFARLHPGATLWSGSYHHAVGKGLELGLAAGGVFVHGEKNMPGFGGILDHTLEVPRYRSFGGLVPQDREIWEILVDRDGERFYAEDCDSVDARSKILATRPEGRAWVVFDETIRQRAPELFQYWPGAKAQSFYSDNPCVASEATLEALAARCGINPAGLVTTVAAYNHAVETGEDALGRKFLPCKIERGPFYAVGIFAYTVRTYGGLKVDAAFRVLDASDRPITGLYAIGELLGSIISGAGSVGGMGLTPALVFGRRFGEQLPIRTAASAV
jgi:fumarate reductase flavoprotein subunit